MSKMTTDIRDMSMALANLSFFVPSLRIGQIIDDFHTHLEMTGAKPYYLSNKEYVGMFCDFCIDLIQTSC